MHKFLHAEKSIDINIRVDKWYCRGHFALWAVERARKRGPGNVCPRQKVLLAHSCSEPCCSWVKRAQSGARQRP